MKCLAGLIGTMLLAAPADAAVGSRSGAGPVDNLDQARLVKVTVGEKQSFYDGVETGCPAETAKCRRKAYVISGDILVATAAAGDFTYVEYVSRKGANSQGAIRSAALKRFSSPAPISSAWTGNWKRDAEADIKISRTGQSAQLHAEGSALWGALDPVRVKNGGVHTGELSGNFEPQGEWGGVMVGANASAVRHVDRAHRFPYNRPENNDCRVRLRLLGPYLLAYDDGDHCGGMNVSFTGVYRRQS